MQHKFYNPLNAYSFIDYLLVLNQNDLMSDLRVEVSLHKSTKEGIGQNHNN